MRSTGEPEATTCFFNGVIETTGTGFEESEVYLVLRFEKREVLCGENECVVACTSAELSDFKRY